MHRTEIGQRGILVLTPPFQIVYMNVAARAIVTQFNERQPAHESSVALPLDMRHFCRDVMALLQDSYDRMASCPFEFRRETGTAGNRLLLRGLVFPEPGDVRRSYACIFME
jgi:hypothetical protein